MVPEGSFPLPPPEIEYEQNSDGSLTVEDPDSGEYYNSNEVERNADIDEPGYWTYEQVCSWQAETEKAYRFRPWGARFSVPDTVVRRIDREKSELKFDLAITSPLAIADDDVYGVDELTDDGVDFDVKKGWRTRK